MGDTLGLGADSQFPEIGSFQMNELSIVLIMSIALVLSCLMCYAVGFKEGRREGFTAGRSITRQIRSSQNGEI